MKKDSFYSVFLTGVFIDQLGKGTKTQDRGITLLFIFPRAFKPKEANLEISKMVHDDKRWGSAWRRAWKMDYVDSLLSCLG